jgi:hypothetical protein
MSKLPTFKKGSDESTLKVSASNANQATETASVFVYNVTNERRSDQTIEVSG